MIFYLLGWILNTIAALMLVPFAVSIYYNEGVGRYFLICSLAMFAVGFALTRKRPKNSKFYAREGFVITALS